MAGVDQAGRADLRALGACILVWGLAWLVIFVPTWSRYEAHQEQLAQRSGDVWHGQPLPSYLVTLTIVFVIGGVVCGALTYGAVALLKRPRTSR